MLNLIDTKDANWLRPIRLGLKPELWFLLWVGILLLGPALFVSWYGDGHSLRYVDSIAHTSLEAFCGLTALLIAGLLFSLSHQYRQLSLAVFGFAFAAMGGLDIWHAATSPREQTELFIKLHTLSAVIGGGLMLAGVVVHFTREPSGRRNTMTAQWLFLSTVVVVGGALFIGTLTGSATGVEESFPIGALRLHELAGALFAVTATACLVYYRATHHLVAMLASGLMLLFAESVYLFRFSFLWDMAWWSWHLVKAVFYLGILVVIAVGLVMALRAVERSRSELTRAHTDLRDSNVEKEVINRELAIRNRMVSEAINCLDLRDATEVIGRALSNFIDADAYELILSVPDDEVPELQRGLDRQRLAWTVRAVSEKQLQQTVSDVCRPGSGPFTLSLRANDRVFGMLTVHMREGATCGVPSSLFSDLAAEIGPIIYTAILDENRVEAIGFRTSLLKVTSMLGSTLELDNVLERVCRESTQLLGSDAAIVFLRGGQNLSIASQCILASGQAAEGAADLHWADSDGGRTLLKQLLRTGQPVALLHKGEGPPPLRFASATCDWGAAAAFPLRRDDDLAGVMVLLRKEPVAYSRPTLDKGMLLAESVRIAVNNSRAYKDLRDANCQLREAEAQKLRAERLAVLGQMAASVAHEVRNPLGAIENCLAVLRSSVAGQAKGRDALEIVEGEVQRLERLTGNFLSFGKPRERASQAAYPVRIAEQAIARIRHHIAQEQLPIRIALDVRGQSGPVLLDSDGFHEVLSNLLLNATQAIEGEGRVEISVRVRSERAYVMVKDDGPGIPADRREEIFEPFVSQRSHGAGLGLAIVRQLVGTCSGRLRIFGGPGRGTCFALSIPRTRPRESPANRVKSEVRWHD
ncbi:GAF domain-containing protein [Guyparkeria sp. SCN-R1]|uniref:sensor histidine kinase n=1 Tax=Guyparkeria sp. SCN-R1 TaxID=2341113 RepID=UPI000F64EAD3|nr:ATP-binding protein [Guyparkeria sp. SCN-R1]RRQ24131.1 GAF domain-containing protein [Guyparkeria sp. SCN-R1]